MNAFQFADPMWLALLALIPALCFWRRRERPPSVLFANVRALAAFPKTFALRLHRVLPAIEAIGLCLLIIALARPQFGRTIVRFGTQGVALVLAIDRSGSMRETDLDEDRFDRTTDTRLDVVKRVLLDFMDEAGELPGRPNDVLGLVSFAGFAQAHTPLTLDHQALMEVLKTIEPPEAIDGPRSRDQQLLNATAIGDGLLLSLERLSTTPAKSKIVILLSDGENNTGIVAPKEAAATAKERGVKVYTIGIGRRGAGLDEQTLEEIATETGGRYWNVRRAQDLTEVYRAIDALERTALDVDAATRWRDVYAAFAAAGLLLLVAHRLLSQTRLRTLP